MFCQPANPAALFDKFWKTWVDDFETKSRKQSVCLDENQLRTMLLLDLELRLQSFEKELLEFGLPKPSSEDLLKVQSITTHVKSIHQSHVKAKILYICGNARTQIVHKNPKIHTGDRPETSTPPTPGMSEETHLQT